MNTLISALRFVWRDAVRQPETSLLIIITLALGVGVNTAIFSMSWHVLLAPLPYTDGDRLVALTQNEASTNRLGFGWSNPTFNDFREQATTFSDVLEYNQYSLTLVGQTEPWQGNVGLVTGTFFDVLGVQPVLGRSLQRDDDIQGAEPVALLSYELWSARFDRDPGVIGTTLEIQRSIYRIVGVLPPIPGYPHTNDVWIPQTSNPYDLALAMTNENRRASVIGQVIGKLQPGVSLEQAEREASTIAQRLVANYPDDYAADYMIDLVPVKQQMTRDATTTTLLLTALALLVVLVASANVANLNLSRTMARHQEFAIREAVGASPNRIGRQLLAENLMLALIGGVLGLLLAWPCLGMLADFASGYTPLANEISMNGPVLVFSLALALVTGGLGSIASIGGRRNINSALKEGGDKITTSVGRAYRRNALLVVQFALAFMVLTISVLITLSLWQLNRQDTGFVVDQMLAVNMILNIDLSERDQLEMKMRNAGRSALTAITELPEVEEAAIRTGAPLLQQVAFTRDRAFDIEGRSESETRPFAAFNMISESYFSIMGIPLLQGRAFLPTDDAQAPPVAIVNESFARRFLGEGNAIGRNIQPRGAGEWLAVIGVVADVRSVDIDKEEGPVVYLSFWQNSTESVNVYVKTAANPDVLAARIGDAVHTLDPRQAVLVKPLHDIRSAWLAPARLRTVLICLFGALALVVTISGVVGVMSCNVNRRVREIGIRMALGAAPARVKRLFVLDGLSMCVAGVALGLLPMLMVAPVLQPLLYQTSAYDIRAWLITCVLLMFTALGASWLPASRAAALSPTLALRSE